MEKFVSWKERVAYGLGDAASNFFYQFVGFFGVFYYTDIFGLPAATVGTMMVVVRLLDALVDPAIGIWADRTKSRWGKFRPFLLWGAVPYGALAYAMFMNPGLAGNARLIYAYATYTLMWIAYSAVNIPYSALLGVISPSSDERKTISTVRFTCAFIATLIITSEIVTLKNWLGHGNDAEGIRWTMLIFAVLSVVLFLVCFRGTRERVLPPPAQAGSLRRDLSELVRNRSWVILFVLGLTLLTSIGLRNALTVYYFKYASGAEGQMEFFNRAGFLAFIAGTICTRFFLKLGESRNVLLSLYILVGGIWISFFFFSPHQYSLAVGLNTLANFLAGPQPALLWAMYADCADYGEWKSGRRSTALVFSSAVLSQKAGLAFAGAITGWMLAYYGFAPNHPQSPETVHGIVLLFSVVPGGLAVISGLIVLFYPLKDAVMKTVEQELTVRKAAAGA